MSRTTRAAFTLIELLVVISIISLLIAILLPALEEARHSAQRLKCMSMTRQVGLAMLTYASEFNDDIRSASTPTIQPHYIDRKYIYEGCPIRDKRLNRPEYALNGKYAYNSYKAAWADLDWRTKPFSQAPKPSKAYLIGEWYSGNYNPYNEVRETWEYVVYGWSYKGIVGIHRQRDANWFYIDGHAKNLSVNIPATPSYFNPNPLAW